MKNIKYFIVAIILMLTSCIKYTDLKIYFDKDDLDKNSLYYIFFDGKLMEVEGTSSTGSDIYVSPGGKNKTVKLDYSYTMNGTLFSSKDGGLKSYYLDRSKDLTGESYFVDPTGDRDEPLRIRNFDDIPSSSGSGGSGGGGSSSSTGNWERSDGGSYLKLTSSQVFACNASTGATFSGTYNPSQNKATLRQGSTSLEFYIYLENENRIRVEQYVSGNYNSTAYYNRISTYPC